MHVATVICQFAEQPPPAHLFYHIHNVNYQPPEKPDKKNAVGLLDFHQTRSTASLHILYNQAGNAVNRNF